MLTAVNCGHQVDPDKFEKAANDWLDKFHSSDIAWNWLNVLLHMFFHHGAQILRELPVASGLLTEEPQEACNRKFEANREHHAR